MCVCVCINWKALVIFIFTFALFPYTYTLAMHEHYTAIWELSTLHKVSGIQHTSFQNKENFLWQSSFKSQIRSEIYIPNRRSHILLTITELMDCIIDGNE